MNHKLKNMEYFFLKSNLKPIIKIRTQGRDEEYEPFKAPDPTNITMRT